MSELLALFSSWPVWSQQAFAVFLVLTAALTLLVLGRNLARGTVALFHGWEGAARTEPQTESERNAQLRQEIATLQAQVASSAPKDCPYDGGPASGRCLLADGCRTEGECTRVNELFNGD